jgi:tetratricopeptide (TPR) repeat protein
MRASRSVRRKLLWLVRFLEVFFGREGLEERARRMITVPLGEGARHVQRRAELALAFAANLSAYDEGLSRALECHALDSLRAAGALSRALLRDVADVEGEDCGIVDLDTRREMLAEARRLVLAAPLDWDGLGTTAEEVWEAVGGAGVPAETKLGIARGLQLLPPADIESAVGSLRGWNSALSELFGPAVPKALSAALRDGTMTDIEDLVGADAAAIRFRCADLGVAVRRIALAEGVLPAEETAKLDLLLERATAPWAIEWRADRLWERGLWADAASGYSRCVEADPSRVTPWMKLCEALLWSDPAGIESFFRQRSQEQPGSAGAWAGLGVALSTLPGKGGEAEDALRMALALSSGLGWAKAALAFFLQHQPSRRAEAASLWREAVAEAPELAPHRNNLAWTLFLLDQDLEEAEAHAREAVRLVPEVAGSSHTLACILARRGVWAEAFTEARRYLTLGDEDYHQRTWPDTLRFFRLCVQGDRTAEAVTLLDDTGFSERWRPLHAALQAAALRDPSALTAVAPEVRAPARALLDELWPTEERPATPKRGSLSGRRRR